jgi:hypothetical protein
MGKENGKRGVLVLNYDQGQRTAVIPVLESEESIRKDNDIENY